MKTLLKIVVALALIYVLGMACLALIPTLMS